MRRIPPWLLVLVALGCWLVASLTFFPLKRAMHYDEAVNYAQPAVAPSPTEPPKLLAPLFETANGALIRALAGGVFVTLPVTPDGAFRIYKLLVFALTLGALWLFGRRLAPPLAPWLVLAALAAPMTWIQANEVMTEPLGLAAALFFLALVFPLVDGGKRTRRELASLAGAALLIFLVKFDMLILVAGTTLAALGLRVALARDSARPVLFVGGALAVGFVAWAVTRSEPGAVFSAMRDRFSILGNDYSALALGMNGFDKLAFGPRIFFWLYFPALPLVGIAVAGWIANRATLGMKERFLLVLLPTSIVVFALAYRNCLQERYFHLPNTLALIAVVYGVRLAVQRWGRDRRALAVGAVVLAFAAFDYAAIFRRLPCFANMQIYGPYQADSGGCDAVTTLFGAAPRRLFVSFPHLQCRLYFPHGEDGADRAPFDALATVRSRLERGVAYAVAPGSPNYLTPSQLILWHLEQFGQLPAVPFQNAPTYLVSLAFPPQSPHNSVVYSLLERNSLEQADALWKEQEKQAKLHIVHEERNGRYTLRIARMEKPQ